MPELGQSTGGRPPIVFTKSDWDLIEDAARIHCTQEEISALLKVDMDTLSARIREAHGVTFSEYTKQYYADGKKSLRRRQWEVAEGGNPTMLIWLGKQQLGQRDQPEQPAGPAPQSVRIEIVDGRVAHDPAG